MYFERFDFYLVTGLKQYENTTAFTATLLRLISNQKESNKTEYSIFF